MAGETITFGEVASLVRNTVQPKEAAGMPYIGLEHIEEGTLHLNGYGQADDVTSTKFKFSQGDILFGKLRPYFRKVIRAPFDGVCSTDIWVVRIKPGLEQGYIFYWMASQDFVDFATQGSEGTKMPRAKWEHVCKHERQCLSTDEQRAIAHILGSLDDKIELNRRMNETLEAMARAIFKSWFVDFDPVRAKAEGRDTGLPKEIADLFPDSFQDSELGEIPKGWKINKIDDVCFVKSGKRPPLKSALPTNEYSIPVYGGNGISWYTSEHLFKPPFVLTGRVGTLGTSFLVKSPAWVSDNALALFPKKQVSVEFIHIVLSYKDLEILNSGSTQPLLTQKSLKSVSVVLPSKLIMDIFSDIAGYCFNKIIQSKYENTILEFTRDTLLPKLISGEIRVKDAERFVERAL